jgi:hypothetical protein
MANISKYWVRFERDYTQPNTPEEEYWIVSHMEGGKALEKLYCKIGETGKMLGLLVDFLKGRGERILVCDFIRTMPEIGLTPSKLVVFTESLVDPDLTQTVHCP